MWPAAQTRVVAVGATDGEGNVPPWSPEPSEWPWVDVLAVGQDVESTFIDGRVTLPSPPQHQEELIEEEFKGFARWSGTSFAAARVSGAIAQQMESDHVDARVALERLIEGSETLSRRDGGPPVPWIK